MLPEHLTLTHTFMYIYIWKEICGSDLWLALNYRSLLFVFFLIKLMSSVYCSDRFIGLFWMYYESSGRICYIVLDWKSLCDSWKLKKYKKSFWFPIFHFLDRYRECLTNILHMIVCVCFFLLHIGNLLWRVRADSFWRFNINWG